ncbi:unnamed protein product [Calypogeia fissa]
MFGRKCAQLVRELALCDEDQFRRFNTDLFNQVVDEAKEHYGLLSESLRKIEGLPLEQAIQSGDYGGGLVHHTSILRNKRCLMGYMYNRAQRIQQLRWQLGAVLPEDIQEKLSQSEKEFFKRYSDILGSYMSKINLDLIVDATPPKDPYIQVRVMDNIGEMLLDDQATTLLRNSIHFMKRTEAESLVSQGLLEEFNE